MSAERNPKNLTLKIPVIKAESETQTFGQLISRSPDKTEVNEMETAQQTQMSLRKRRNLSKNRGQATRQREKTPEPSRTPVPHEDTTTSDDEEIKPVRSSREIEADNTYEEMKRLVHEKANVKDPVYDLDIEEVLEARAIAANERRRRSISPFAIPEKEEIYKMERKGSFIDPNNKLLSTTYCLSPKDEDNGRRNSLTIEPQRERANSLSPPVSSSASPKDTEFPYPMPTTPKKLEELSYSDENCQKQAEGISKSSLTPVKKDKVFTFDQKDERNPDRKPSTASTKTTESSTSGELVTKVIQVERTPSKKLSQENKPTVEIRERVVRTPSRKMSADIKPIISKQNKQKEELQNRAPPIKPARSKSASKFGGKTSESETSEDQVNLKLLAAASTRRKSRTSESEMSEDQTNHTNLNTIITKRKVVPTPRRFQKNKSPRANRSRSANRIDDVKTIDKTGTAMSQTSREILELMQKARARSLSIPKDDPRMIAEYKDIKNLQTPNKTPATSRSSRGISCPKTIQIISDKEILLGLAKLNVSRDKSSRHSSGYIDASQSEYTSSCYSSSPSENEYDFDLTERTAELTRKLNLLSEEVVKKEAMSNIMSSITDFPRHTDVELKSVLRKRSLTDFKKDTTKESKSISEDNIVKTKSIHDKYKKLIKSRWKLIANWQQFKVEQRSECEKLKQLRNRCVCNLLLLVILCGLGGMMFKTLEGSFENAYKCSTRNVKRDFIESLWRGSHYLREEDWKSMARKKLYEFENQLHTAHEAGVTSYSGQRSWNFMNSFVYCLTLITTIGYGHIAPKTTYGRIATIVYAIIGIPLFLIVLADFGKLFTRIIKFFWAFIRRFYYTRSCRKVRRTVPVQEVMKGLNIMYEVVRRPSQMFSEEDMGISPEGDQPPPVERKPSDVPPPLPPKPGTVKDVENDTEPDTPVPSVFEIDDEFNVPISVAIFILVVYLIIGAVGYNMWETWTFFESFYFVFISMSTIGLGDLVPDHPMFMMASILYLVFGLALTSMCINVVQVKLSDTFKQASAKLGATIGLQVSDEDGSLVPITPTNVEVVPVHKPKTVSEGEDGKSKEEEKNENDSKSRL